MKVSGLCGWIGELSAGRDPARVLVDMTSALLGLPDEAKPKSILAGAALGGRAESERALFGTPGGLTVLIAGKPEWTDPDLRNLCTEQGAGRALAQAYRTHGATLFRYLEGAFAFAVIDANKKEAFLAIDRFGLQTLRYACLDEATLVFASQSDALRAHPRLQAEVSAQSIFDYLYFSTIPGEGTIYRNVRKLLPGHYLFFRDNRIEIKQYYRSRYEPEKNQIGSLSTDLFTHLRGSVRKRVTDCVPDRTGAFLSGGLDSSTVLGLATEALGQPIKSFTTSFDVEAFDELSYARLAARHFGSPHTACPIGPDETAELIPRIAEVYDEPFGNSSAVPTFHCARCARDHGVSVVLAGDGGDELFAGNERYVLQQKLGLFGALPSPLRAALEGVIGALPVSFEPALVRKARGYVRKAKVPMPKRLEAYNLIQPDTLTKIFEPDFIAVIDPDGPHEILRSIYEQCDSPSLLHRMMHLDLQLGLADNDLRKVTRMCDLAGVQVRFPFLDEKLVEFASRLPPDLLIRHWRLRHFYKQAMRGFLPRETIAKKKHGFGLPFRIWMAREGPLRELVNDTLGRLGRRGIVRASYLDHIIDHWNAEEAKIYAPFIWGLTILELWLDERGL